MSQEDIQTIEVSIEFAKKAVERKKLVYALESNRAFKEIILKGFFEEEPARLAMLSSDPALTAEQQAQVIQDIRGLGTLRRYLRHIVMFGSMAEQEIRENETTLDQMREEASE